MLGGGNTPSCRPAGPYPVGVAHTVLCGGQELFLTAWEPTPVETRFSPAGSGPDRQSTPPRQCLPPITPHHRPLIYARFAHRPTATGCLPTPTVWGKSCLQS